MIYRYLRFSTNSQDERQQANTIDNYLKSKGMNADETFTDAGISGGTSYKKRNLFELCNELKPNDVIIVSEVSRITRSGIGELSEIIEHYFKPNKLRLIICNVGLDVDCSDLNPMIEMQLMMMATFAKIEKQLICDRTKSALESRKKQIAEKGYFISKAGNKCTKLGNTGDTTKAIQASRESRRQKALNNPHNKEFWEVVDFWQQIHGKLTPNSDFQALSDELNKRNKVTSTGLPFTKLRARAMFYSMSKIFSNN